MKEKKRKYKRSLIYTQGGKTIEEELTYEKFLSTISYEYCFTYKNKTIDIAFHYEYSKQVWELNINCDGKTESYLFYSSEELINKAKIDGKSIREIWDELEN